MCHPEVPEGTTLPDVRTEEAAIPVAGGAMPALIAFPERTPAPAVLVINDVFGRSPFYEHLAGRLAQAGFVAATPEFFDISAATGWLRERGDTAGAASVCYYGFPADARTSARPIDIAPTMRGPILGLWGDHDAGVGMDNVEKLDVALTASGVPHEFHVYPGLGHGFLKASLDDANTPGYREACDSWTRTIAFFRESFARSAGWSVAGTAV